MVFSSMNPTGERLKQMTGVAAILKYDVPGCDDIEEDDENSSTDSSDTDDEDDDPSEQSSTTESWDE